VPSFEIYGGVAGLYDYGPLGSMTKSNVEQQWRQHFVLEEDMLEVTCSNLTLDAVLETSVKFKFKELCGIGTRRKVCRFHGKGCEDWYVS
jgi:glycyl-tRNA synthetase (class II)